SETCPECGRDLTRPRAIRTGERRRRRWAIALGALLLLASLGAIGAGSYATLQGANLNPWKPAWLLAMEAGNPTAAAGALAELTTRIQDDRLSDVRMESLVARALEHQADVNQTWIQEWGDLVETAWTHDHISRADYERYMRQTIDWEGALSLPLRERIEQGERLTVSLDVGRARAGATSALWLTAQLARVAVSGDVTEASGSRGMLSLGAQSTGRFSVSGPTIEAPPGKKPVEAEWRLIVGARPPSRPAALGGSPPDADAAPEAPEVEWSVTLSGEIEVVPAGTPVVTEIDDPSIEQDLRAAVTFDRTSVRRQEDGLWPTGNVSLQERSL